MVKRIWWVIFKRRNSKLNRINKNKEIKRNYISIITSIYLVTKHKPVRDNRSQILIVINHFFLSLSFFQKHLNICTNAHSFPSRIAGKVSFYSCETARRKSQKCIVHRKKKNAKITEVFKEISWIKNLTLSMIWIFARPHIICIQYAMAWASGS